MGQDRIMYRPVLLRQVKLSADVFRRPPTATEAWPPCVFPTMLGCARWTEPWPVRPGKSPAEILGEVSARRSFDLFHGPDRTMQRGPSAVADRTRSLGV